MQTRIDNILHMLDSPIPAIKARALLLLGHEQHMLPLERLAQLYEDRSSEIRIAVLKYLSWNLPPGHTKFAIKALLESTNTIRVKAIEHLISFPDKDAAPILETLLKKPDFPRKDLVIRALSVCDDGRALSILLPILENTYHTERMLASNTIGKLGVQPVINKVLDLLDSDDEINVRVALAALVYANDDQIIGPVLSLLEKWQSIPKSQVAYAAISLLDKFRDVRIHDTLLQILVAKDSQPGIAGELARSSAIYMLAHYPDTQVMQYLMGLLQSGGQSDRQSAIYALTHIGSVEAVDALLTASIVETESHILSNYSSAFASLHNKRAVPILEAILQRVDPLHRSIIEFNLRALNPPTAKPHRTNLLAGLKRRLYSFR